MVYLFIKLLFRSYYSPILNLLRYITIRAVYGAFLALALGLLLGPKMINILKKMKIGQYIRKIDPTKGPDLSEMHKNKAGTPTMGGIIIILTILIAVILFGDLSNRLIWLAIFVTLCLGAIGFVDDYLKIKRTESAGLRALTKLIGQTLVGFAVGFYLYRNPIVSSAGHILYFPFFKNLQIDLGWFYIPFVALIIVGASNAVNLTDGLDGLAIGCVAFSAFAYTIMTYIVGRADYAKYLLIPYVAEASELTIFSAALVGASLSFLWYNSHPAQIFMGDTGSLSLGGILGLISILLKQEVTLLFIGGIFVIEALSVIIQVVSFKLRGKRVFLMTPLHHHFERKGIAESKIIVRFWIIQAILVTFGLSTLKLR